MFELGDEYYMRLALQEAKKAYHENEIPVGAIIVANGHIIAKAHNQTEKLSDPTAHAEMLAITSACNAINNRHLHDCTLYVTLEPCIMCGGGIHWAQLKRIVIGAKDEKKGVLKIRNHLFSQKTEIITDILADESEELMNNFFKKIRK